MGRKSRAKRERHAIDPFVAPATTVALDGAQRSADETVARAPRRRLAQPKQVGARVARVAVEDETWAAFRALCGDTPASIRLGQLVEADVRRARAVTPESEAAAAVTAIRAHVEQPEDFIRRQG